jgi:hypothetical protein
MQCLGRSIWKNVKPGLHQFSFAAFLVNGFYSFRFIVNESSFNLKRISSFRKSFKIGGTLLQLTDILIKKKLHYCGRKEIKGSFETALNPEAANNFV